MKFFSQYLLAMVVCSFIADSAIASVILTLTDDGTNMTFHYTGTMDLVEGRQSLTTNGNQDRVRFATASSMDWYSVDTNYNRGGLFGAANALGQRNVGTYGTVMNGVGGLFITPSNGVGFGFGIRENELFWGTEYGTAAQTITVDRKFTLAGTTVDDWLGTNTLLNSGPVLLWTHDYTGSTVSLVNGNLTASAVPEPSSIALLGGLGVIGLIRYRRQKRIKNS